MDIRISDREYTCGIFHSAHTFPDVSVTQPRRVVSYEIEVFAENGGVTYLDGVPHQIRRGSVLCARPGSVRYSELPLATYYVKLSAKAQELTPILEGLPPWLTVTDPELGKQLILAMLEARAGENMLFCHAKLLEFLAWLSAENQRVAGLSGIESSKNREAVSRAMSYMEEHFRESCTLEEVAANVHLSPVYFHGIFRRAVGKTPHEYVLRLKVEEAKRLLLIGGISMAEVAEACGFSTQSYFNHVFRAQVGHTPGEYRRRMLAEYFDVNGIFEEKQQ